MPKMLTVEYDSMNGIVCSDGMVEHQTNAELQIFRSWKKDREIMTTNFLMVTYLRVLVSRGDIKPDEIRFKFGDDIITCDKNGRLSHWPKGFCDMWDNYLDELLQWNGAR